MKIYVGHSTKFDYKNELYLPLSHSALQQHQFIFPHENSELLFNSKEELKNVDLMLAEVSYPALGLGIEIGWATAYNVPVIAIYKNGLKLFGSVKSLAQDIVEYQSLEDWVNKLSI